MSCGQHEGQRPMVAAAARWIFVVSPRGDRPMASRHTADPFRRSQSRSPSGEDRPGSGTAVGKVPYDVVMCVSLRCPGAARRGQSIPARPNARRLRAAPVPSYRALETATGGTTR